MTLRPADSKANSNFYNYGSRPCHPTCPPIVHPPATHRQPHRTHPDLPHPPPRRCPTFHPTLVPPSPRTALPWRGHCLPSCVATAISTVPRPAPQWHHPESPPSPQRPAPPYPMHTSRSPCMAHCRPCHMTTPPPFVAPCQPCRADTTPHLCSHIGNSPRVFFLNLSPICHRNLVTTFNQQCILQLLVIFQFLFDIEIRWQTIIVIYHWKFRWQINTELSPNLIRCKKHLSLKVLMANLVTHPFITKFKPFSPKLSVTERGFPLVFGFPTSVRRMADIYFLPKDWLASSLPPNFNTWYMVRFNQNLKL